MKNKVCLDTGIITLACSENVPKSISALINDIREGTIEAYILSPIIVEIFYHICKLKGKEFAECSIVSFLNTYPIKLVNLNRSLIIKAGILKCQHRKLLSYNDCYAIAYALNRNMTFHTTEKELKEILPNLKVKKHKF